MSEPMFERRGYEGIPDPSIYYKVPPTVRRTDPLDTVAEGEILAVTPWPPYRPSRSHRPRLSHSPIFGLRNPISRIPEPISPPLCRRRRAMPRNTGPIGRTVHRGTYANPNTNAAIMLTSGPLPPPISQIPRPIGTRRQRTETGTTPRRGSLIFVRSTLENACAVSPPEAPERYATLVVNRPVREEEGAVGWSPSLSQQDQLNYNGPTQRVQRNPDPMDDRYRLEYIDVRPNIRAELPFDFEEMAAQQGYDDLEREMNERFYPEQEVPIYEPYRRVVQNHPVIVVADPLDAMDLQEMLELEEFERMEREILEEQELEEFQRLEREIYEERQ